MNLARSPSAVQHRQSLLFGLRACFAGGVPGANLWIRDARGGERYERDPRGRSPGRDQRGGVVRPVASVRTRRPGERLHRVVRRRVAVGVLRDRPGERRPIHRTRRAAPRVGRLADANGSGPLDAAALNRLTATQALGDEASVLQHLHGVSGPLPTHGQLAGEERQRGVAERRRGALRRRGHVTLRGRRRGWTPVDLQCARDALRRNAAPGGARGHGRGRAVSRGRR